MELFVGIMVFILGLCFGSFVNMLVYRTAVRYEIKDKGSKINDKRSFCDYCGRQLSWYENIPVISWLILKGRTKCCDNPLPWDYPVVEIMTGVLFLSVGGYGNPPLQIVLGMGVIVTIMYLVVFDGKYMILPDIGLYVLLGLGVFGLIGSDYMIKIGSGLTAFGFMWLLTKIKIKGKDAMGNGDPWLALFMGLWLGYPQIILAFYVAFIVGAFYGLVLLLIRKAGRLSPIPFGPFLMLGTLIAWFFGNNLLYYFYSLL